MYYVRDYVTHIEYSGSLNFLKRIFFFGVFFFCVESRIIKHVKVLSIDSEKVQLKKKKTEKTSMTTREKWLKLGPGPAWVRCCRSDEAGPVSFQLRQGRI